MTTSQRAACRAPVRFRWRRARRRWTIWRVVLTRSAPKKACDLRRSVYHAALRLEISPIPVYIYRPEYRTTRPETPGGPVMDTPKRLLVVGDGSVFGRLKDWLFVEKFEMTTVPGGMEALTMLRQGGLPHLVVLDLDLHDMDGLDLCRELQQYGDLPVVVLVRDDVPGQAARVLQYADDYIRLPVDPDELVMRIRRILSRVKNFDYAGGQVVELCDFLAVDY